MADGPDWVLSSDQNGVQVRLHIEAPMDGPESPYWHEARAAFPQQDQGDVGLPSLRRGTLVVGEAYFTGGFRFAAPKGSRIASL